ncbi:hypothetical protein L7F22_023967 [Adiantum nelumboides]|nr:hypothetical protein [Adiantum nelumboides]
MGALFLTLISEATIALPLPSDANFLLLGFDHLAFSMASSAKPQISKAWATAKPFVNGGVFGMLATCVIQPVDIVKMRIQLGQGSALHVAKTMLKEEGFGAYYRGLFAGLLRQATYTTTRLGSFKILTNKAMQANGGKPLPLY